MNKRQVIILWVLAAVLAGSVAFIKLGKEQEIKSATNRKTGDTLLQSFPAADVGKIEIKGTDSSVTLEKKDGKWILPQRENYPAKTSGPSSVNDLLRTVADLKIAQGMQAGPSFAARFGMDENSKEAKEHGINLIFKDAAGKDLANITVGKTIESASGDGVPMMGSGSTGRFVRNHADESGFYAVSELFPSLGDQVKNWIAADDFLRIEKIKSISVTRPGSEDLAWKAVRNNEESGFALEGAAAGEEIEPATASALQSLFAYSRFDDVAVKEEAEKRAIADQKRVVTITTFEGFTYTITITPAKPADPPAKPNPEDPSPAADEFYLMTVAVDATIPKERKKEEGEKPEDAKTKDEAFATRTKDLNERLAKDKAFAPYTFLVVKSTVEQVIKDRTTLTKKPDPQAGNPHGGMPNFPGGMPNMSEGMPNMPGGPIVPRDGPPVEAVTEPVEVSTPPVSSPAEEKPAGDKPAEEKPADSKPAEEKPADAKPE